MQWPGVGALDVAAEEEQDEEAAEEEEEEEEVVDEASESVTAARGSMVGGCTC